MSKRVLITGASGLLGRVVYREFEQDADWETLGLAFSRAKGKLKKVDLTNESEVDSVFQDFKPSVVIHSAAERRPDVVENKEDATRALNVSSTQTICNAAAKIGAWVLFISTDYVFDGKNPPYKPDDETNPLNKYGDSKLEGEKVVLDISKDNSVLRVPILYGEVEYVQESAVTILFEKVKDPSATCKMSDYERRFPTYTGDIAKIIKQMAERRLEDPTLAGRFHWSSLENMTKYNMSVAMGEVFNLSTNHIEADKNPSAGAPRPFNTQLDSSKLEGLGIKVERTLFKDGIKKSLEQFA